MLHSSDYFSEDSTLAIEQGVCLTATIDILKAIAQGRGPDAGRAGARLCGLVAGAARDGNPVQRLAALPGRSRSDFRRRSREQIFPRAEQKWASICRISSAMPATLKARATFSEMLRCRPQARRNPLSRQSSVRSSARRSRRLCLPLLTGTPPASRARLAAIDGGNDEKSGCVEGGMVEGGVAGDSCQTSARAAAVSPAETGPSLRCARSGESGALRLWRQRWHRRRDLQRRAQGLGKRRDNIRSRPVER